MSSDVFRMNSEQIWNLHKYWEIISALEKMRHHLESIRTLVISTRLMKRIFLL